MYEKLIAELRQHHCDAREDDTQEVCEECSYDVIIADKSVPSGIASVCVCGLMHRAADTIEELTAADVRPVVLCRDCKNYIERSGACAYLVVGMREDDFCSYGKKREES